MLQEPKAKMPDVLVEHNSVMRGAIPCLPVPLAWFCLVWNFLLPGTGTINLNVECTTILRKWNLLLRMVHLLLQKTLSSKKNQYSLSDNLIEFAQEPFGAACLICAPDSRDFPPSPDWNHDSAHWSSTSSWAWANCLLFCSASSDGAGAFGGASPWSA